MTCSQTRRPQIKTTQTTKRREILSKPRRRRTVPVLTGRADDSPALWVCGCVRCGWRWKKSCFNCTCHEGVLHSNLSPALSDGQWHLMYLSRRPHPFREPQGKSQIYRVRSDVNEQNAL